MIKWELQHGIVTIPKSVKQDRIKSNADVFDFNISEEDMEKLNGLNEGFRCCPDPNTMD